MQSYSDATSLLVGLLCYLYLHYYCIYCQRFSPRENFRQFCHLLLLVNFFFLSSKVFCQWLHSKYGDIYLIGIDLFRGIFLEGKVAGFDEISVQQELLTVQYIHLCVCVSFFSTWLTQLRNLTCNVIITLCPLVYIMLCSYLFLIQGVTLEQLNLKETRLLFP